MWYKHGVLGRVAQYMVKILNLYNAWTLCLENVWFLLLFRSQVPNNMTTWTIWMTRIYQTHIVKESLDHKALFSHTQWTRQSSDLNIIKYLWDVVEKVVTLAHHHSQDFGEKRKQHWKQIKLLTGQELMGSGHILLQTNVMLLPLVMRAFCLCLVPMGSNHDS